MARLMVGSQVLARNHTSVPATSRAIIISTRSTRPRLAEANEATPRGVNGSQADRPGGRVTGWAGEAESGGILNPTGPAAVVGGGGAAAQRRPPGGGNECS